MSKSTSPSTLMHRPFEQAASVSSTGGSEADRRQLARQIGFWAAIVTAGASIIYSVVQIIVEFSILPSPWDQLGLFAPSLLVAWAFLVLMVSIHSYVPLVKKLWSLIGLGFAIMYATVVSVVYFTQVFVVVPHVFQGQGSAVANIAFFSQGSPMPILDALGYSLMSLATLFAAPAFAKGKLEGWIRWFFIANGSLVIVLPLTLIWPSLIFVGALWMITIPVSTVLLAVLFKRAESSVV